MDTLRIIVYRLSFIVAVVLLILATIDWVMRLFGCTLSFLSHQPGRLFEFAGILLVLVIALLLREIRDKTRTRQ